MKVSAIDWKKHRAKLAKVDRALSHALDFDVESHREILNRRALALAARKESQETLSPPPSLVFRLGKERFAAPLDRLRAATSLSGLVRIPGAPRGILGALNVRGVVATVWDLGYLLDVACEPEESGCALIVSTESGALGLRVDYAEGSQEVKAEGGQSVPEGLSTRFLRGISSEGINLLSLDAALDRIAAETQGFES